MDAEVMKNSLNNLKWPKESVCGESWCPTLSYGYCVDCHSIAYNSMLEIRRNLGIGLDRFLGRNNGVNGAPT